MAKHNRPTRRPKTRQRSHGSSATSGVVSGRRRLRWILMGLTLTVIAAGGAWIMRKSPRPAIPSKPPTPPASRSHVLKMLDTYAKTVPQSVSAIQQEELALAESLVQDYPKRDAPLALLATVHQSRGDTTQAEALWKQAVALNPKRIDLYKQIGEAAQSKDQIQEAVLWWRQGLKVNGKAGGLRWLIANALITQGHLDSALELLEAECVITPKAARNYYLMGQIHLKQRAYERAKQAYAKAIAINPAYYNAHYGLGMVYVRMKQPDLARQAMAEFQRLKAKSDTSEDQQIVVDEVPVARRRIAASYGKASALYDPKQQTETAAILLKRALELDASNARLWEKMAGLHYVNGRIAQAIRCFQEADKLEPTNAVYCLNIGKLYAQMNRFEQAEVTLQEAVARFPASGAVHAELARLYLKSHTRASEALALMQKAVAVSPTAQHYYLLTWAHDVNGDQAGAMKAVEKAIALEPQNPQYRSAYERFRSKL